MSTHPSQGMILDGVAASQAIDSSAEVLDVEGCDISSLPVDGVISYEHLQPDTAREKGIAPGEEVVGKILVARKVIKESDAEGEREKMYWEKVKAPFIYIIYRLFDAAGHRGAQALAAAIRDAVANDEQILVRLSIEGSTLEKKGNVLKSTVARRVAATWKPCNRVCDVSVLSDPQAPPGFNKEPASIAPSLLAELADAIDKRSKAEKSEPDGTNPMYQRLGSAEVECDPLLPMEKALEAGSYAGTPSSLTGGAALQIEDPSRTMKARFLAAHRDYDGNRRDKAAFKRFAKARMPEVDDSFLDRFADAAEDLHVSKIKLGKGETELAKGPDWRRGDDRREGNPGSGPEDSNRRRPVFRDYENGDRPNRRTDMEDPEAEIGHTVDYHQARYHWLSDHHGGANSPEYRELSSSPYGPASGERSPEDWTDEENGSAMDWYNQMCDSSGCDHERLGEEANLKYPDPKAPTAQHELSGKKVFFPSGKKGTILGADPHTSNHFRVFGEGDTEGTFRVVPLSYLTPEFGEGSSPTTPAPMPAGERRANPASRTPRTTPHLQPPAAAKAPAPLAEESERLRTRNLEIDKSEAFSRLAHVAQALEVDLRDLTSALSKSSFWEGEPEGQSDVHFAGYRVVPGQAEAADGKYDLFHEDREHYYGAPENTEGWRRPGALRRFPKAKEGSGYQVYRRPAVTTVE